MPSELYFKMVYQNASKQCACIWSAIEKIDDAARTVKTQLDNLQAEWKGEAGSTAYGVLFAWYIDLVRFERRSGVAQRSHGSAGAGGHNRMAAALGRAGG